MKNNKFIVLKSLLKNYNFDDKDIVEYMSYCDDIGLDTTDDLDNMKKILIEILSEIEIFSTKNEIKDRRIKELSVQLFKVSEAASKLSISEPEIRKLIKAGEIKTVNITNGPRGTRISLEEIKRLAA